MKIRFRIRTLLALTALVAIGFTYYVRVERPRLRLIAELERNGGRIVYSDWSIRRPWLGSRVEFVSVPLYGYDNIDTDVMLDLPHLTRFGVEDRTIRTGSGQTITYPWLACQRDKLPLFVQALDSAKRTRDLRRRFLPEDVQLKPRPLTDAEKERVESAAFLSQHQPQVIVRGWRGSKE